MLYSMAWGILASLMGGLSKKDKNTYGEFDRLCAKQGRTPIDVLRQFIVSYIASNGEFFPSPSPVHPNPTPSNSTTAIVPRVDPQAASSRGQELGLVPASSLQTELIRLKETMRAARELVGEMDGPGRDVQEQDEQDDDFVDTAAKAFLQGEIEKQKQGSTEDQRAYL